MGARLKVFVTSDGLTDYVVAVSSRAKAMAAWGVRQDVFKEGLARETDDPQLVEAAQAQPGVVLRRPAGSRARLAKLRVPLKSKPTGPSKGQRRRLVQLERRLTGLDAANTRALAKLDARISDLQQQRDALALSQERERAELAAQLAAMRDGPG